MNRTFLILDDDISVRKMLGLLIKKNNLGNVVAELENGQDAVKEILFYNPDIVLIDLLLPILDGIQIIKSAQKEGYKGKFIMISQVEDEDMISRAYECGIVFFINKPINNIEVINVIKGVCHNIEIEASLSLIKRAVLNLNSENKNHKEINYDEQITEIFTDLGIVGNIGSHDMRKVIHKVINIKKKDFYAAYELQKVYEEIIREQNEIESVYLTQKAFEQRIRRTIQKALENIAELGCDDYCNSIFMEYNSSLFDFKQVRQEMHHIKNSCEKQGKISTKKFVEGIIAKMSCF